VKLNKRRKRGQKGGENIERPISLKMRALNFVKDKNKEEV
jgi:hypothetical protein